MTTPDWTPPGLEQLERVGEGGMGAVYRAWDPALRRHVAVKVIRPDDVLPPDAAERFRREAAALAGVTHPNVVTVFNTGEHAGRPYLVMEYLPGGSLAGRAADFRTPLDKAALVAALARAAHAAHAVGVVHRDIKPGNVLLAADGTPKLADFGLVRLTDDSAPKTTTNRVLGTPGYLAPEQVSGVGGPADARTDVFALGVVLYELLTGRRPFDAATDPEYLRKLERYDPPRPSTLAPGLPRDIETVCLKCLEKPRRKRYATAAALADDLARFAAGEPILARPPSARERVFKWARENPMSAASGGVLAVALAVTAGGLWYERELGKARGKQTELSTELTASQATAVRTADAFTDELVAALRPLVGTQSPAVEKLLARAEEIVRQLEGESDSPEIRGAMAKVMAAKAEVYAASNRAGRALAHARDAVRRWDEVLAHNPGLQAARVGRARTLVLLGELHQDQGDLPAARAAFEAAVAAYRGEVTREPDRAEWKSGLATALTNSGNVLSHQAEVAAARTHWDEAFGLREQVYRGTPTDDQRREFGVAVEKKADDDYEKENFAESRRGYERAVELYAAAHAAAPQDTRTREALTRATTSLGEVLRDNFAAEGKAVETLERGLKHAEFLADLGPTNIRWARERARAKLDLLLARAGDADREVFARLLRAQLAGYREEIALADRLRAADPDTRLWENTVAEGYSLAAGTGLHLSKLLGAAKQRGAAAEIAAVRAQALADARTAVGLREPLLARDPTNYTWAKSYVRLLWCLADLTAATDPAQARESATKSLTLTRDWHARMKLPGSPYWEKQLLALIGRLPSP